MPMTQTLLTVCLMIFHCQSLHAHSGDVVVSTNKVYLTANQSMIILPLLYVEQTPLTEYIIIGFNVERKSAMPIVHKYQEHKLPIIISTQTSYSFYFPPNPNYPPILYMSTNNSLFQYQISQYTITMNSHTDLLPYIEFPHSIQAIKQNTTLLWNQTYILYCNNIGDEYKFVGLDLSEELDETTIAGCNVEKLTQYVCFTSSSVAIVQLVDSRQLTLKNIYTFQEHQCILNIELQIDGIRALCDCHNGCFNYQLTATGTATKILEISTPGIDSIIAMKLSSSLFKGTMYIASQNILTLYVWKPYSVTLIDSLVLPQLDNLNLHAVQAYQQYFQITYTNERGNDYKNVYIWYESSHGMFVALNVVTKNLYASLHGKYVYEIDSKFVVICRHLSPEHLVVHGSANVREVIIYAFQRYRFSQEEGLHKSSENDRSGKDNRFSQNNGSNQDDRVQKRQQIIMTVYPAAMNAAYIKNPLPVAQSIQFNQDIQIEFNEIFEWGGLNNYSYAIYHQNGTLKFQQMVSSMHSHRVFSLYSLLPCVKMFPYSASSFRRTMLASNGKLYTEECVLQDYFSDYLCSLQTIQNSYISFIILQPAEPPQLLQDNQSIMLWKIKHKIYMVLKNSAHCHIIMSEYAISTKNGLLMYGTYNPSTMTVWLHLYSYTCDRILDQLSIDALIGDELQIVNLQRSNTKIQLTLKSQNHTHLFIVSHHSNKLHIQNAYKLPTNISFIKLYRQYLFILNNTHLTKYSTLSNNQLTQLYSIAIPSCPSNPFQRLHTNSNYLLLIYQHSYHLYDMDANLLVAQLANQQLHNAKYLVYDVLVIDSSTVLVGVDKSIRSYTCRLVEVFGGFKFRQDRVYQQLLLVIQPIKLQIDSEKSAVGSQLQQKQTFTVSYINQQVFNTSKNVQSIFLPYTAINQSIKLAKDMLMGPIYSYSISDTFSNRIVLYNHLQLAGNIGIMNEHTLAELAQQKYTVIAKYILNSRQEGMGIILSNNSHILSLSDNKVEWRYQLSQSNIGMYFEYLKLGVRNESSYVFVREGSLMLLRGGGEDLLLKNYENTLHGYDIDLDGKRIRDYTIHSHRNYLSSTLMFLLLEDPTGSAQLHYINLTASRIKLEHPVDVQMQSICQLKEYLFYIASPYLCVINLNYLIESRNKSTADCRLLSSIIPHQYYLTNANIYTKLQSLKSSEQYKFILYPKAMTAMLLTIVYNVMKKQWTIQGCYVGKSGYTVSRIIGYAEQYLIVEYSPQTNATQHVLIAYYNNNDDYQSYCQNLDNAITVQQSNTTVLLTAADNHQQILMTNITAYTVRPNLQLICNYKQPLPLTFLVIHGSNQYNTVNYYCRLHFKVQDNKWYIYASAGFGFVALICIVCRIVRCFVQRGIIKWPSLSSSSSGDSAIITFTDNGHRLQSQTNIK